MRRIRVANPNEKPFATFAYAVRLSRFSGPILCYATDAYEALEVAAEWAADHAPGNLVPIDEAEPCSEGCDPFDCDCLTYTESGFVPSDEWRIVEAGSYRDGRADAHTKQELRRIAEWTNG